MHRFLVSLAFGCALTGCGTYDNAVKLHATTDLGCSTDKVEVSRLESQGDVYAWTAKGCGKAATYVHAAITGHFVQLPPGADCAQGSSTAPSAPPATPAPATPAPATP